MPRWKQRKPDLVDEVFVAAKGERFKLTRGLSFDMISIMDKQAMHTWEEMSRRHGFAGKIAPGTLFTFIGRFSVERSNNHCLGVLDDGRGILFHDNHLTKGRTMRVHDAGPQRPVGGQGHEHLHRAQQTQQERQPEVQRLQVVSSMPGTANAGTQPAQPTQPAGSTAAETLEQLEARLRLLKARKVLQDAGMDPDLADEALNGGRR